ncbi:MAG: glycosyltransferase [Pseudoxanthomonas sp.]
MTSLFWLSAAGVVLAYAGYPLLMAFLARVLPRPVLRAPQTPMLDVVLVVHNGAAHLTTKLANLKALDYPVDQLNLHVVCDGCSDASAAIARACQGVQVHVFAQRRGKSACLADVVPRLRGELVLFTDVRQRVEPEAARALAAVLADPSVGAASGELMLEADGDYGRGVDAYWRYEKSIRKLESASGSLVGVTGALYCARREALPAIPAGLVLDDMWIPLAMAARGWRVVFEPAARAWDRAATDPAAEERRKRRTLAGNFQLIHRWPQLAIPGAHPLALRLWGHKWLRLLAPWLLLAMLVSSAMLALGGSAFFGVMLALQVAGWLTALAGRLMPATARWLPVRLAAAFASLNTSALIALPDYLLHSQAHLWQITPARDA